MASIQKRGENSWRLTVELGTDARGKRKQYKKTIRVEDETILRAPKRLEKHIDLELKKFQLEVEAGAYVKLEKMKFADFIDQWERQFVKVELELKTQDSYLFHAKRRILPYFGHLYMDQIKTMHILDYFEFLRSPEACISKKKERLGSATQVYNFRVLQSIFTKAVEWQVLQSSPMDGVKKPKENDQKEMSFYDQSEIEKLFEALEGEDSRIKMLFTLAVTTGLRRGELCGLEWKHLDFKAGTLSVRQAIPKFVDGLPVIKAPKTKKSTRTLALPASVLSDLSEFQKECRKTRFHIEDRFRRGEVDFVFSYPDGRPYNPQSFTIWWIDFHKKHGLKAIRFHDLRHTSVSWMIYKKIHASVIAKRVGHSNTQMLDVYGHVFESADREAAQVFDDVIPFRKKA
jgi:integrase